MVKVKLNDVAIEARETWKQSKTDVPVVGLEHLEPDEIWLKRWDLNPDENTFTKGFRKGQLLFGRRRAYQKKMSVASCDGICSGDITVISAKPEKILPDLLPFYLRTDAFFDFAVRGSGGSLSPRVKWSHISDYEFDLPPMEEQKKLAELLWAANDLKEKYKKAITATDEMLKAKFREMFGCVGNGEVGNGERGMGNGENFNAETQRHRVVSVPIGLIGDVYTGSTPSMKVVEYYENREIPFYKPSDFQEGITTLVMSEFYVDKRAESKCRMFDVGAVLVTCIGTVGKVGLATMPGTCNQQINFIVPNSKIDSKYLAYAMVFVGEKMAESAKASVVPIINKTEFCNYKIPLPPLALQREFVAIAEKAEAAKASLKKSIADIDQVMKGLINQ